VLDLGVLLEASWGPLPKGGDLGVVRGLWASRGAWLGRHRRSMGPCSLWSFLGYLNVLLVERAQLDGPLGDYWEPLGGFL
jgi:hypothetical protein